MDNQTLIITLIASAVVIYKLYNLYKAGGLNFSQVIKWLLIGIGMCVIMEFAIDPSGAIQDFKEGIKSAGGPASKVFN